MTLEESINRFYLHMTISEVKGLKSNEKQGLGNVGYNTLLYLYLVWGLEPCTPSQLATALGVTRSAVTIKINELIKLGLIERKHSSADGRIVLLEITQEVREYLEGSDRWFQQVLAKAEGHFAQEQLSSFCEILEFITDGIKALEGER